MRLKPERQSIRPSKGIARPAHQGVDSTSPAGCRMAPLLRLYPSARDPESPEVVTVRSVRSADRERLTSQEGARRSRSVTANMRRNRK